MEAEGLVDVLEGEGVEGGGDVAARGGRELGRLAVREEHLAPLDELRLALHRALDPVRGGTLQEVEPFVGAAHAPHPALAVADPDHAH